jgi:uridylate kinase
MIHILSLGGSIVVPDKVNIPFLKKFKALILKQIKKGDKFVIVVGGGKTCRNYIEAAKKTTRLSTKDTDWLGIEATKLNAQLLKTIFKGYVNKTILTDPTAKVKFNKPIFIGAGFKPGHSTDLDAVNFAIKFKAKTVLNLSNINYVYDKDPNKYKGARPLKHLTWKEFFKFIDTSWGSGKHYPFDPVASKLAKSLKVIILKGTNIKNLEYLFNKKPFRGTIIN